MSSYPTSFLWGAASAGHQIEGGNVNSDTWRAEWAPGSGFAEPSGDACDSYHRYAEDIGLLAAAGLDTYRFSVEWARIEPEEGWFSRAELDHYRRMVATCVDRGVTPMLTYNHFTTPRWFADRGGWSADGSADLFARYAGRVTQHLGDLVPWVCTINEANIVASVVYVGMAPAGHRDDDVVDGHGEDAAAVAADHGADEETLELLRSGDGGAEVPVRSAPMAWPSHRVEVMAEAHHKAIEAIKSERSEIQVGWTLALIDLQSVDGGEERLVSARKASQLDWLDVSASDDFVGVQTYSRERIGPDGLVARPHDSDVTQTGWEVYPQGLEHSIRLAAAHAGVPIVVTENGMATADDDARIEYTRAALGGIERCLADGIDVRGYLHWSLLDNFEWTSGFKMTFGLIAVDRESFVRTPKPSLAWLGEVAQRSGAGPTESS